MTKSSFILPPNIRQLRDLMRYRTKLTYMLAGEKDRALNCLTISNLKLDDVLWHVRQLFAFHQSIHFGSSWRAVRCDSIS